MMTPTDVTTSDMMCLPSAKSAGDRMDRPARIRSQAHSPLTTVATPLTTSPRIGWSIGCGLWNASHASLKMRSAATMMSAPSTTAEKYSALWWPKGWLSSAGLWLTRIAHQATADAMTLTMDSSASE